MSDPVTRVPDIDVQAIRRRWSTYHDRSADDYTDAGCRVLAEHAFRDVPALLAENDRLRSALRSVEATVCRCDWDDQGNPDPPDPRCEMHGTVALLPENEHKRVPDTAPGGDR